MGWVFWLGTALAVVGACVSIPQTVKMLVHRNIEGLSITSYVAWTLSWGMWVYHSTSVGAYPKAVSEALGFIAEGVLLITLVFVAGTAGLKGLLRGFGFAVPGLAGIAVAYVQWGTLGLAVAVTLFDAVYLIPQIRMVLVSPSLSGLSLSSYSLRSAVGFGWVAYGFALSKPEVGGWGFIIGPFAAYVSVKILLDRRRTSTVQSAAQTNEVDTTYAE